MLDHEVGLERRQPHTLERVRRQRVLRPHEVVLGGVRFGFVEPLSERDEPDLLVVLPSSEVQDFLRLTGRVECGGVDDRRLPHQMFFCPGSIAMIAGRLSGRR